MQSCYLRTSLALHHLYLRRCFPLPGFPRAVTCPGSLGSSSLGQFLLLSLSWLNLMFLKHDFVATLVAQMVKDLSAMQETRVHSLGREDPLEKDMATHSGILAWRIPWTEEPGGLQSTRLQRVRHDLATKPPPFRTLKLHTKLGTIWYSHPHHCSLPRTV